MNNFELDGNEAFQDPANKDMQCFFFVSQLHVFYRLLLRFVSHTFVFVINFELYGNEIN